MVTAFGINLKVEGSSPLSAERFSVSKTSILSQEHPLFYRKNAVVGTQIIFKISILQNKMSIMIASTWTNAHTHKTGTHAHNLFTLIGER